MSHFVLIVVFGGLGVSALLLAVLVFRETQRILAFDRRLSVPRLQAVAAGVSPESRGRRYTGHRRQTRAFAFAFAEAASMLAPVGAKERGRLAQNIRRAGFGHREALTVFLTVKLVSALTGFSALGLWAARSEMLGEYAGLVALATVAGFVVGSIVPEYGLRFLITRRSRRMGGALPDALDLTVMCLESGLTFERALTTVADELTPIEPNLARELRLLEAELRVGSERRAVLQEFHQRTDVEGLRDLAMTLIQSERFGTPLAQSMRNIAASERTQRTARIEAQTERLPVLMTLPMLLFVVPGTMALVAGPAFLVAIDALRAIGQ